MIKTTLKMMLLAVVVSCQQAQPEDEMDHTNDTAEAGEWKLLFDGKTTNGWHTYGKETVGEAWKVEDGTLYLDAANKQDWQTSDGGDLVTEEEFDNFHLKLEWKIAKNGNSGIIFYVQDDPATYQYTWSTGLEMQVLDNEGHPDAKIDKHRAGNLYDLIASSPENVRPAGEWNQVEIISNKGQLEFQQNGEKVLSTTLWDDSWKQLVAGSKFADMPNWGTFKSGKIALQDHGDSVWFRNIQIRRL
ncbi:DUF1080 domain-containing protein [Pontibacter sp. 13R65]|uniref:3-keto-disaccharide hydrolase n=1 Tax=Pontibacter sp. 13R65 TaxID=3127458 RepID=UPI0039C8FECE